MKAAPKLNRPLLWLLILSLLFSALLLCGGHLHRCAGDRCPVCQAAHLALTGDCAPKAALLGSPVSYPKTAQPAKCRVASARSPVEKCDELTA